MFPLLNYFGAICAKKLYWDVFAKFNFKISDCRVILSKIATHRVFVFNCHRVAISVNKNFI